MWKDIFNNNQKKKKRKLQQQPLCIPFSSDAVDTICSTRSKLKGPPPSPPLLTEGHHITWLIQKEKKKNPSTSQTSQHFVAANVWSCPAVHLNVRVESESVFSFYSTFHFHAVKCDVSAPGSDSSILPCHAFCQDGVVGVWAWGPTCVRRSPDEANVSPRFLSLAHFCEFYCMRMAVLGLIVSLGSTPVLLCVRAQTALIKLLKCCL